MRVDAVVGSETTRELCMRSDEPQRLLEAADQRTGRDQLLVDLGVVVRSAISGSRSTRRDAQSKACS